MGKRQQPPEKKQEHCSTDAPSRDSINWICSGCSTACTSSSRTWLAWNRLCSEGTSVGFEPVEVDGSPLMLWRTRRDHPEPLNGQDKERGLRLQGEIVFDSATPKRLARAGVVGTSRCAQTWFAPCLLCRPAAPSKEGQGLGLASTSIEDGGAHAVKPWRKPVVPRRSLEI